MTLGLVLSGGAARGAYEAGVLRYLFVDLPRRLGRTVWPDVVSGTSVGALNGLFAVQRDVRGIEQLSGLWRGLRVHDVYRLDPARAVREGWLRSHGEFALLDPRPFRGLLRRQFPAVGYRAALDSGACRAYMVATTEVATGFNALFVDSTCRDLHVEETPGSRVYRRAIGVAHCAASAAIPFLFPAVAIDGHFHVDGGLRQNTPLRPVLRAGVDRVIVIGLKQPRELEAIPPRQVKNPGPAFLAGKMMNALMLDPVERDLWQAESINRVIAWGEQRYGSTFAMNLAAELGLRHVQIEAIHPSEDLGRMALDLIRTRPPKTTAAIRLMLQLLAGPSTETEADLLSYLYFDAAFTAELETLGFEDARREEQRWATLLLGESAPSATARVQT